MLTKNMEERKFEDIKHIEAEDVLHCRYCKKSHTYLAEQVCLVQFFDAIKKSGKVIIRCALPRLFIIMLMKIVDAFISKVA